MQTGVQSWVVFCLVFALAHLVQGITGFGAVVLTLAFLAFVFPVKLLVPVLVVVSLAQMICIAIAGRRQIHWRHAGIILLLALAGLPLGYLVYRWLPAEGLKIALGAFVVLVAGGNLLGLRTRVEVPGIFYYGLNVLGGIFQGALATGGPLLIIYAARMLEHKAAFRATLALVWIALNAILCVTYLSTGVFTAPMLPMIGLGIGCMALGTVLGALVHARIPQKPFRVLVFSLLLVSGLALLVPLG
ncbi:MAG: sulfite exporter TauE/SafE family protein [Deltaproteobacteria bacterium]|nr:sulfite exporter TauE/SafE family protein [Deltaproteobacteria bacterium]